jgi:glucan 1,3-beta-glucosidase
MFRLAMLVVVVVAANALSLGLDSIKGVVIDSDALLEISRVKVRISGEGINDSALTDSLGKFKFACPLVVKNFEQSHSFAPTVFCRQINGIFFWQGATGQVSVGIINPAGKMVKKVFGNSFGKLSLVDLATGVYLIRFSSLEGIRNFKYLNFGRSINFSEIGGASSSSFSPSYLSASVGTGYKLIFEKTSYKPDTVFLSAIIDSLLQVKIQPIANTVYRLDALNFSPYRNGQNPNNNVFISRSQIIERMSVIRPYTKAIRTFTVLSGLGVAAKVAHNFGLKTFVGAWIGRDTVVNNAEIDTLIAMSLRGEVDTAAIGSEALLRGDITEAKLIEHINRFRAAVPNVPVATADVYSELISHPNVVKACDFLYGNFYPYWEGVDVKYGVANLDASYHNLLDTAGGKRVLISEAGWPSNGDLYGQSLPSLENAAFYFLNLVSWSKAEKVSINYFEAFDETWKTSEGSVGANWGIFDTAGIMKSGMQKVFDGDTIPNNWSGETLINGPGTPAIDTTVVPALGSYVNLQGTVSHVIPKNYGIVVYIKVGSNWWIKPTYTSAVTKINVDGSWTCDVTTGGVDETATQLHVFLVPKGYTPPSSYASFDQTKKVAELLITRTAPVVTVLAGEVASK